VSKGGG
jgi:hypothetical protein